MDDLHKVLRTIRTQTKSARNHVSVFREFLSHLERLQRKAPRSQPVVKPKAPRRSTRTK